MSLPGRTQQIQARYVEALQERRAEEFRRGVTVVGPHRDEIEFQIDGRDLSAFGSRGQQRLAVIAYKLAETDLIATSSNERPILLLDDVLSELDRVHRDLLLNAVSLGGSQVIVTSTDEEMLHHPRLEGVPEARVDTGVVSPVAPAGS
jgi:DNA replication and repair protein RecF